MIPFILDCDPGQDDAIAILLALASPELELLGITTVCGNVPLALVERNARMIVELGGGTVPVLAGCPRPLVRDPVHAPHIHGESGLAGAEALPPPSLALDPRHAVGFITETLAARPPGTVVLCAVGPLTNLACVAVQAPELFRRAREIVLMGGAIGLGNVTPSAEFNIYADPHAAKVVFESGVPLTMVPLDLTHQALANAGRIAVMEATGGRAAGIAAAILRTYPSLPKFEGKGGPLHDPCAVAVLLWPELMGGFDAHVSIETEGDLTLGRTVVDRWGRQRPNTRVLDRIDADGFFARLAERLGRLA